MEFSISVHDLYARNMNSYSLSSKSPPLKSTPFVKGVSVHEPRQSNSMYIQTVSRLVYKTRWPKHPHLPIRWHKQFPQGPTSRPRYMESYPEQPELPLRLWLQSLAASRSLQTSKALQIRQYTTHCCVLLAVASPSLALAVLCLSLVPIQFDSRFSTGFDSGLPTRFDSCFLTGFNSGFFSLVQRTFNAFIFDSSHILWVASQSGFRSPTLARMSLKRSTLKLRNFLQFQ